MSKLKLSVAVQRQIPEYIRNTYPQYVEFIKAYYDFLEQTQSRSIESYTDLDNTLDDFVQYFKNQFASLITTDSLKDKRFFLKHVREFYLSKGSEESYKFLFKTLFDKEVSFFYPSTQVLKASDGKWHQDISIFVKVDEGDPSLFELAGNYIDIYTPKNTIKMYVDNVIQYSETVYEVFIERKSLVDITIGSTIRFVKDGTTYSGRILKCPAKVVVYKKGAGFKPGDIFSLKTSLGNGCIVKVVKTDANGGIQAVHVIRFGLHYETKFWSYVSPRQIEGIEYVNPLQIYDGTSDAKNYVIGSKVGTYSVSGGTECLITANDHNLVVGDTVNLTFTTNSGVNIGASGQNYDGNYTVVTADSNYFTVDLSSAPGVSSGSVSVTTPGITLVSPGTYQFAINYLVESNGNPLLLDKVIRAGVQATGTVTTKSNTPGIATSVTISGLQTNDVIQLYGVTAKGVAATTTDTVTSTVVSPIGTGSRTYSVKYNLGPNGKPLLSVVVYRANTYSYVQNVKYTATAYTHTNVQSVTVNNLQVGDVVTLKGVNSAGYLDNSDGFIEVGYGSKQTYMDYDEYIPATAGHESDRYFVDPSYVGDIVNQWYTDEEENDLSQDYAILEVQVGPVAYYPGYYLSADGFISDEMYIHDGEYYQAFSYVIKVEQELTKYVNLVKDILHPAGMRMFAEYDIRNILEVAFTTPFAFRTIQLSDSLSRVEDGGIYTPTNTSFAVPSKTFEKPIQDTQSFTTTVGRSNHIASNSSDKLTRSNFILNEVVIGKRQSDIIALKRENIHFPILSFVSSTKRINISGTHDLQVGDQIRIVGTSSNNGVKTIADSQSTYVIVSETITNETVTSSAVIEIARMTIESSMRHHLLKDENVYITFIPSLETQIPSITFLSSDYKVRNVISDSSYYVYSLTDFDIAYQSIPSGSYSTSVNDYPLSAVQPYTTPINQWTSEAPPQGNPKFSLLQTILDGGYNYNSYDVTHVTNTQQTSISVSGSIQISKISRSSNVVTVTTSTNHTFNVNDKVLVNSLYFNSSNYGTVDGIYTITAKTTSSFSYTLNGPDIALADTSGTVHRIFTAQTADSATYMSLNASPRAVDASGATYSVNANTSTCTITTAVAHGFVSGSTYQINFGAATSGNNITSRSGKYVVTVINSTTFTVTLTSNVTANSVGVVNSIYSRYFNDNTINTDVYSNHPKLNSITLSGTYSIVSGSLTTCTITSVRHGLTSGETVSLAFSATSGTAPKNSSFTVTVTGTDTFTVTFTSNQTVSSGNVTTIRTIPNAHPKLNISASITDRGFGYTKYTSSGTNVYPLEAAAVSSFSKTSGVVTIVTSSAHDLITGDYVYVVSSNYDDIEGVHQITKINNTTFTYQFTGSDIASNNSPTSIYKVILTDTAQSRSSNRATKNMYESIPQSMEGRVVLNQYSQVQPGDINGYFITFENYQNTDVQQPATLNGNSYGHVVNIT